MAYFSTSGLANNTADMLARLKDFLITTCGWTLHDDEMGNAQPYFVAASHGESGKEDIYLQFIKEANANIISVRGCLYWDNTTHAAVKETYSNGATAFNTKDSASFVYWIYANLDRVFIVTKIGTTYYGHYSGIVKRFWSDKIAVTQAAISSGNNIVAQVDDASIFTPGKPYIIKDNANIERSTISAVNTSVTPNTVTFTAITKGYASGAKIGEDPQPLMVGRTSNPGMCYAANRFDGYSGASSHSATTQAATGGMQGYADPDARYGLVAMFPWLVVLNGSGYEECRGELIDVFAIGPGAGASEDVIDLGISTYKIFMLDPSNWCAVKE